MEVNVASMRFLVTVVGCNVVCPLIIAFIWFHCSSKTQSPKHTQVSLHLKVQMDVFEVMYRVRRSTASAKVMPAGFPSSGTLRAAHGVKLIGHRSVL